MPVIKRLRLGYQALALTQNKHRFYFLTIPVSDLYPYCFVSRRDEDSSDGFQRALNEARARDIAEYLNEGNGSIPTNIVLSAQLSANLSYTSGTKLLRFARTERSFLVLDGQHRLWGYHLCLENFRKDLRVPVAIYERLSRAEEAKLFVDINTTQRGVPAALLLDIKSLAEIESQRERILRTLFDRLSKDKDVRFGRHLSAAKSATGKISRVAFNRSVGKALDSAHFLRSANLDERYKAIKNYINAFTEELEDESLLRKQPFFEAIFEIFEDVAKKTMGDHKNLKQASIQKTIGPLAQIDYVDQMQGARMTTKALIKPMKAALQEEFSITGEML